MNDRARCYECRHYERCRRQGRRLVYIACDDFEDIDEVD